MAEITQLAETLAHIDAQYASISPDTLSISDDKLTELYTTETTSSTTSKDAYDNSVTTTVDTYTTTSKSRVAYIAEVANKLETVKLLALWPEYIAEKKKLLAFYEAEYATRLLEPEVTYPYDKQVGVFTFQIWHNDMNDALFTIYVHETNRYRAASLAKILCIEHNVQHFINRDITEIIKRAQFEVYTGELYCHLRYKELLDQLKQRGAPIPDDLYPSLGDIYSSGSVPVTLTHLIIPILKPHFPRGFVTYRHNHLPGGLKHRIITLL